MDEVAAPKAAPKRKTVPFAKLDDAQKLVVAKQRIAANTRGLRFWSAFDYLSRKYPLVRAYLYIIQHEGLVSKRVLEGAFKKVEAL